MDVKKINSTAIINSYLNNIKQAKNKKTAKEINKVDKIELSPTAKQIGSKLLREVGVNKNEQIQEIKNSLAKGTYNINPNEIAKKMMENMRG